MPPKRVAIVQPSYMPWKGYFDLIRGVDEFILLDDVQFTRRDWRSRNQIKSRQGLVWLTVPVRSKGRYTQLIRETTVAEPRWAERHWATIRASYARAPFFGWAAGRIEAAYASLRGEERLSAVNHRLIAALCEIMDIHTPLTSSSDYAVGTGRNERLIELCAKAGASAYLSGPSAREYLDTAAFERAGIEVQFADYSGYPEYPQVHPPFEHHVSAVDLLCCTGPDAVRYMKRL